MGIENAISVMNSGKLHRYNTDEGEISITSQLEVLFSKWQGAKYCLACTSGGVAIQLALRSSGVKPGDKVLANAFTLAPVPGAIENVGAKAVLIDIDDNFPLAKSKLGVVNQEFNFSQFEKVQDVIMGQAGYYGVDPKTAKEKTEHYLKKLGIWDKRDVFIRELSGGQKRRVMIIKALIHEPELLILDEPTAGVDIELRRGLWDFLIEINKSGTTIILTTHYLEEAENLCRNIAIIDNGQIIENTKMDLLLQQLENQIFTIETEQDLPKNLKIDGFKTNIDGERKFSVIVPKDIAMNKLFNNEAFKQLKVTNIKNQTNRLEELFINLTSKK